MLTNKKTAIRIEITNVCNLKCIMCPQSDTRAFHSYKKGFMDDTLFKSIIDQISTNENTKDAIVGFHITGEPTLHPSIPYFAQYTASKGMHIRLNTNATKLTPELSEKLVTSGLQEIVFSFEGFNKKEYERIRVGANYEETLSNIKNFIEINNSHGHPVKTELFVVRIPGVDPNLIDRFHNNMKDLFDNLCFVGCMDWVGQIELIKNEYPIILSYNSWCSALDTDLNVLYDGTVVPCCFDVHGKMPIGHFSNMTLDEILESEQRNSFIEHIKSHSLDGTLCKNCTNMLSQKTIILNSLLKPKRIYRYVRNLLH